MTRADKLLLLLAVAASLLNLFLLTKGDSSLERGIVTLSLAVNLVLSLRNFRNHSEG